jgi:formylglycine-generating enzyme required for sulfatase activity
MPKNKNKRAIDIAGHVERSIANAGDNNVFNLVYNSIYKQTDTRLSAGFTNVITLVIIAAVATLVTAILLAIVSFVFFPAETKAKITFLQFIFTFFAVLAAWSFILFFLLKILQNIKALIIILIPLCMAFSVASAAYLLDENVFHIIERILSLSDSENPDIECPPEPDSPVILPCAHKYNEINVERPEPSDTAVPKHQEAVKPDKPIKSGANLSTETFKTVTNSFGMKFVPIPAGTFMMGSPKDEPGRFNDETQHEVTISKRFYMQTTEVTQGQWKAVMGNNPSYFKDCGDDCPVERVSWNDIQEFIKKLNQRGEGTYRLPTEAEWEYAARAGTTSAYSWGNSADCSKANYGNFILTQECERNPGKTMPVGSFAPNTWGLYDMHGNVWEWCQDWYGSYPSGAVTDPTGPDSGSYRVLRGGSWYYDARHCRTADRGDNSPGDRSSSSGFRLVSSSGQ